MQILEKLSKSILVVPKHSKFVHVYIYPKAHSFFTFCCHCCFKITKWKYATCQLKKKATLCISHMTVHITTPNIKFKFWARNSVLKHKVEERQVLINLLKYIKSSYSYSNKVLHGPLVFNEETDSFEILIYGFS